MIYLILFINNIKEKNLLAHVNENDIKNNIGIYNFVIMEVFF